jgi:REP element-mobilizing transposase RayT
MPKHYPIDSSAYGGELQRTRKGRVGARPLSTTRTMHVVLRSSKARGAWSFKHARNEKRVIGLIRKHASRFGVRIYSLANVGNHLHFHVQFPSKNTYARFIRAITAAIAMAITGSSRWNPKKEKFWDRRPFSRIVKNAKAFLTLKEYIAINELEGLGYMRAVARLLIKDPQKHRLPSYSSGS